MQRRGERKDTEGALGVFEVLVLSPAVLLTLGLVRYFLSLVVNSFSLLKLDEMFPYYLESES